MSRHSSTPTVEPLEGRSLTSYSLPGATFGHRAGPAHLVVCEGNSLTVGKGSAAPASQGFPAQLQARLGQGSKVLNLGITAQTTERMLEGARSAFARVAAELAQLPNTVHQWTIDVAWEGTNSLRVFRDARAAVNTMREFVAQRHSQQFKVIVLTCLPANNPSLVGPEFESQRQVYNALIRKNTVGADLVVDVASDRRLMDPNSSYYGRDHLHLTQQGYAIAAAMVCQAVLRLEKLPPPS